MTVPIPPQAWYADDSQAVGKLNALLLWWLRLNKFGPAYGYFPKPSKTYLVVKPVFFSKPKTSLLALMSKLLMVASGTLGLPLGQRNLFTNTWQTKYRSGKAT